MRCAQAGDTVLLINERDRRRFIRTLEPGRQLETHRGLLKHDDLIGQPIGSEVRTHIGFSYYLLSATTDDLISNAIRKTQIIFPKDAGYIIMKLGICPGSRVIETGTGSGGLCMALATIVGDEGHVYSYELREGIQDIARQNLKRTGLLQRVTLKPGDAHAGFDETEVDAVFLDMLTPYEVLTQARAALRGGGVLGSIVPTTNQVVELLKNLGVSRGYAFVEVEELILRAYKPISARLRPDDQMVGHTGYLVFARAVTIRPGIDVNTETSGDEGPSDEAEV